MGLKASEHIGMIAVHPKNANIVWVAAYGPLWSAGGERVDLQDHRRRQNLAPRAARVGPHGIQ